MLRWLQPLRPAPLFARIGLPLAASMFVMNVELFVTDALGPEHIPVFEVNKIIITLEEEVGLP